MRVRNASSTAPNVALAHYDACMEETGWWIYLKTVARTEDGLTIAEAAGVTPPQVSRWKTGKNRPDADKLARFARSYGRPPVEALVAAGYLTAEEAAEVIEIHRGVDSLTDEELVAEVQRRMKGMRNALEAAAATGASTQGRQAEEGTGSVPHEPDRWPPGPGWPGGDESGMNGGQNAQNDQ